jgi:adenine phosphoribosyltransferase
LIRKPGKLPGNVEKIDYELEYGRNSFEIEKDSLKTGQKVLVIDDVLATGGTAAAACTLIERLGAEVVEVACLIELPILQGRKRIDPPVFSLISIAVEE